MENYFNKKYGLVETDEFFDDYLKEIGLNFVSRKIARSLSSYCQIIKVNEQEYEFITATSIMRHVQKFKPGEEIIQHTIDGRKIKNIFTFEGENTLIEEQIDDKRKVIITREYRENEMLGDILVKDIKTSIRNCLLD